MLYGLIHGRRNRRDTAPLDKTALGETSVSFAALSQIAQRTIERRPEVKSAKTKVSAIGSRIRIEVRAVTGPELSLPEVTHSLENAIAAAIADVCGKPIGVVDVTVDQTYDQKRTS